MTNNDVFTVSTRILHYINDTYAMYKTLQGTYEELGHDKKNANRCYHYQLALAELSDHIDSYVLNYDNVSVTECLECNSFIWHMQYHIGKMIDAIMSNGYCYVMRDSQKLRDMYHMYEAVYEQINIYCDVHGVYH